MEKYDGQQDVAQVTIDRKGKVSTYILDATVANEAYENGMPAVVNMPWGEQISTGPIYREGCNKGTGPAFSVYRAANKGGNVAREVIEKCILGDYDIIPLDIDSIPNELRDWEYFDTMLQAEQEREAATFMGSLDDALEAAF